MMRATPIAVLAAVVALASANTDAAGDADSGRLLLRQYGCGGCHRIPGVEAARGNVGPPLERIARRVYLAGKLPNTPDNLVRWIREPQQASPLTAMPDLGVTERDARDMAAYLSTLR